jgi:TM2 domain-containing membrane protein YozV
VTKNKKNIAVAVTVAKYALVLIAAMPLRAQTLPADVDTVSTRSERIRHNAAVDTALTTQELIQPVIVDTASAQSESVRQTFDTVSARAGLTLPATVDTASRLRINYTGSALSAVIPGSGQIYQSRYVMGGLFLIAEAGAIGFAAYWNSEASIRRSGAERYRGFADTRRGLAGAAGIDSAERETLFYEAGWYSVRADVADFEARQARHTYYNALAWTAGLHLYNFLDALEAGGAKSRGREKNPTAAGLLAAVPFLGLGQFYNGRPAKAGMLAMAQAGLALTACNQQRLMSEASDKYNQMRAPESEQYDYRAEYLSYWKARYDKAFSNRNTYLWLSLAAYLYSIFDAVVDAYLSDFDAKIDLGTDLSAAPGGGGAAFGVTVGFK